MAKRIYIGVYNKARKVKKVYVGVDGIARKVRRGYIGIGGVARLFWSGGELGYYGTTTPLGQARTDFAATSVGNYALFAGGRTDARERLTKCDAYNASLTTIPAPDLTVSRSNHAATSVGGYALFGGGHNIDGYTASVEAYNASLTRTSAPDLDIAVDDLAATTVGNCAVFAFGNFSTGSMTSGAVNAYDSSLTKIDTQGINSGHSVYRLAATTVGDYALFGGGRHATADDSILVYAFNKSLTLSDGGFITGRYDLAATTVGGYALFAGGVTSNSSFPKDVDVFDASLVHTKATDLSVGRYGLAATSAGNYALFAGGTRSQSQTVADEYATVDAYDDKLTKVTVQNLSLARRWLAATTVDDYALFAGGSTAFSAKTVVSTVDVYMLK